MSAVQRKLSCAEGENYSDFCTIKANEGMVAEMSEATCSI